MHSLFAAAHLGNFTITVYIRQAAAYLKTCEANSAAPSNAAVTLINLYQLLIGGERLKFKYSEFLERNTFILSCLSEQANMHRILGAVRQNSKSSGTQIYD